MENEAVTFQELQNLCDLYHLHLRENKYNGLGDTGYTVINRRSSASAAVPYDMTLQEALEWLTEWTKIYAEY